MLLLMKIIGWIVILLIDIPVIIYRGMVLAALWLWFITPLGVKPVGTAQAIGLSILLSLFTMGMARQQRDKDDETPAWAWAIGRQIMTALGITLAWWFGSIAHDYM